MQVTVALGKQQEDLQLAAGTTLAELNDLLARRFGTAPHTTKLCVPGGKAALHPAQQGDVTLEQAGIRPGARLKMMASRQADVAAVQAARDDRLTPGFDAELLREMARTGAAGPRQPPAGPHTFQRYEAWQRPGLAPPPGEALKLLHRLAADPGIQGVMAKHKWTVGLLSEMPPEGKVGVSPVCILGVNINRGQEISLRLRTDDLRGFRRYDRIKETLLHELAHMVWGEHDNSFKELNSQLRRECAALDWQGGAARSLQGAAFEGSLQYDLPSERQTVMQQTAASSGQTLRELAGAAPAPADPRQAAIEAALRRVELSAAADGLGSQQQQLQAQAQQQQQVFSKGQRVLYRQRDGALEEATVVSVDQSVQPPSYGIQLAGGGRETEAARLAPLLPLQPEAEVQGLGHRDAATEQKEDAVRQLEQ